MFRTTLDGNVIHMNHSLQMILGFKTLDEAFVFINRPDSQIWLYPEKRDEYLNLLKKNGSVHDHHAQYIRQDATIIWVSIHAKLITLPGSEDVFIDGFVLDINSRKTAENELVAAKERAEVSEEKLRLMIKNSNDAFVLINASGEQFFVSDAGERETGYTVEELLGPIDNVIHPDDFEHVLSSFSQILTDYNFIGKVQYRHIHKTRGYVWFEAVAQNFLNNPYINAIVVNVRNIDDIKQVEAELIKAKERAEESDRLKSAFLANMSHEIRTPMNGILGFAELLKEPDLTGDQYLNYIHIIEKSGHRMLNIINDIIDIAKIESGVMKVCENMSNINEQLEYIYTFFKPEAEAKGLKLSLISTLPAYEATINTDPEKLYIILTNLVKNAIKFTDHGSIAIGYHKKSDHLEFFVTDTGIGIPEDRMEAIFERFIQADIGDKMARQGAGLGLGITKAYVEMLGGEVSVVSEVGVGSTFLFTLPAKKVPCNLTPVTNEPNEVKTRSSNAVTRKIKIMVVEDDEISRQLITIVVKGLSSEIIQVKTGVEAIEVCRANPDTDLILMDIRMPGMNGHEATRQIRMFNSNVVIIAHTAYGMTGDRRKALEAGCTDYISKPINKEGLLELIKKYNSFNCAGPGHEKTGPPQ
ncbi:MAG: ATP-binding protein [Bacteroidales bacterium]